jgi:hypothetical protein
MKRWGLVVTGLYFVALIALSLPVTFAAFGPPESLGEMLGMYRCWAYWIWIFVMISGALLLLLVPIRYAERRPKSRRPLLVPIMTSSLFLGLLGFLLLGSIMLAIWGDDGPPVLSGTSEATTLTGVCVVILLLWVTWGVLFYRRTRSDSPDALTKRAASWLLKGSILELLVAVSCHVVVRRRDDCCAPFGTFLGIAAGLSVMLLSFGPGILFLFVDRCRKLKPKEVPTTKSILSSEGAPSVER